MHFLQISIARFKGWDYEQLKKFGPQGRKSGSHAGVPTASTWYPRLRSSESVGSALVPLERNGASH
jgi:hypothetical protein